MPVTNMRYLKLDIIQDNTCKFPYTMSALLYFANADLASTQVGISLYKKGDTFYQSKEKC